MRAAAHEPGRRGAPGIRGEDLSPARARRRPELTARFIFEDMPRILMLDRPDLKVALMDLPDDLEAVNDHFYAQGWTDGLPIVPPTPARVEKMLAGMPWRDPDDVIGVVPPAMGVATLRSIAVNAV